MIVSLQDGFINLAFVTRVKNYTDKDTKQKVVTVTFVHGSETFQGKDAETLDKLLKHTALVDIEGLLSKPTILAKSKGE